jgi:hypothetical protein
VVNALNSKQVLSFDANMSSLPECRTAVIPHHEMRKANGNRVEPSARSVLAESSDKEVSIQHLRPNIEPIYHKQVILVLTHR